ncbi:AraC family transcriptional regulator [Yoonia sp. 2307UL14-13]|uniref:AraC family transcriptional regulator n=1 Tax=Yoonia sp. 2307UL14-13 TaxID=3126506 RepID=UPI0030A982C9
MSLVAKLAWLIELRLTEAISLNDLASACAVSPYHMSRAFRQATGLAPMTYLRARRLSCAAQMLADGDADILQVALDIQYGSHAAFTRAFANYFGVTPEAVRKARSTQSLILMEPLKMKKDMLVDVAAPNIMERVAFRIVGISAQCTFEDNSAIPGLWQQFNAREGEVSETPGPAYGVCCDADDSGHFRYVAGMENAEGTLPKGMDSVDIPAGRYAVFQHSGHISDLPKTVYTIWNKALPESGHQLRSAPDFEIYDQRFDLATGRGVVEIWMPVK